MLSLDDTTLMAEMEEELNSILMNVKVEREKAGLKLNIQRPETIKLLEENIGKTLSDINHRRILCDLPEYWKLKQK